MDDFDRLQVFLFILRPSLRKEVEKLEITSLEECPKQGGDPNSGACGQLGGRPTQARCLGERRHFKIGPPRKKQSIEHPN